jgi:hypothetical protein
VTDRHRTRTAAPSILAQLFGADLRSLALLRVAIALVVLIDITARATDLRAHYTDAGVLQRSDLLEVFSFLHAWPPCIHLMGGSVWSQVLFFALHAAFAIALLVGYRTRLATCLVWLMTTSVQLRNLYIGAGSDSELRMVLFWGFFLPWGALYSIDSVRRPALSRETQWVSVGTVALYAQLTILYLATAYHKSLHPEWVDGTALTGALDDELWINYAGVALQQVPLLCRFLTHLVLWMEFAAPVLLFVPVSIGPIRTATVIALVCMHAAFGIGLRVGLFPFVASAAVLGFLPAWFWERLMARLRTPERLALSISVPGDRPRLHLAMLLFRTFFLLPETPLSTGAPLDAVGRAEGPAAAQGTWLRVSDARARYRNREALVVLCRASPLLWPLAPVVEWATQRPWLQSVALAGLVHTRRPVGGGAPPAAGPRTRSRALEIVCAVFLVWVVYWNVGVLRDPVYEAPWPIAWLGRTFFLQQDWRMFESMQRNTGWVVIAGRRTDGTEIDLFQAGGPVPRSRSGALPPPSWDKPSVGPSRVKSYRWLTFMDRLVHGQRGKQQLLFYGRYLCREWNRRHEGTAQLQSFQLFWMTRPVDFHRTTHAPDEYERTLLWTHDCFG